MFDDNDVREAKQMYQYGEVPSKILRFFALKHTHVSVPDLMQLIRDAFSLSYEDVQCIGGWWHDGTGELTDDQIDAFITLAIRRSMVDRA